MFTGSELPEVSVPGQIIFRTDTKILQVYNDDAGAWEDVAGGVEGTLTYVGEIEPPTPPAKEGDQWYDSANGHRLSIHDGTEFVPILLGADAIDPADLPEGKSAYQVAVDNGFVGTEEEWLASLQGDQGIQGPAGDDGQSLYTWVKYADDTVGTNFSNDPTGRTYIGVAVNKTTSIESGDYTQYQWSLIKGDQGDPGDQGPQGDAGVDGNDGRGISSTLVEYRVSTSGTTPPTGTWSASPVATVPGEFLWTRTITTFTSAPSPVTSYAVAAHGSTGSQGISVTGVFPYWAQVTTGNTPADPTGTTPSAPWQSTEPAYVAGTELWTAEKVTYSSGSPTWSTKVKSSSYYAATYAVATADGKMRVFQEAEDPSALPVKRPISNPTMTAVDDGDLWLNQTDGNKPYVYEHPTGWIAAPIGLLALAETVTTPGTLPDHLGGSDLGGTEISGTNTDEETGITTDQGPTITAGVFRTTAEENQGVIIDKAGLRAYGPSGGSPFMNVDPAAGLVIVAGEGTFDKLVTTGDVPAGESAAELAGRTDIKTGGEINLNAGAIPPTTAPKLDYTYDTFQFTNDGYWAERHGWVYDGSTYYYTCRDPGGVGASMQIERWNASTGTKSLSGPETVGFTPYNLAYRGTSLVVIGRYNSSAYFVQSYNTTTLALNYEYQWNQVSGTDDPAVAIDYNDTAGKIVIAQSNTVDTLRFRHYTFASGGLTLVSTNDHPTPYNINLTGLVHHPADHNFTTGHVGYTFSSKTGDFRTMDDTTHVEDGTRNWETGMPNKVGFLWDNGAGVWKSIDKSGLMRTYSTLDRYETIQNTANTRHIASTYYRSGVPWETPRSPVSTIIPPKRSKVTVEAAALPLSPGANDPNQVMIYVGKGSSYPGDTNMIQQPALATGVIKVNYTSFLTTPDVNPPAANNFPVSGVAKIASGTKRTGDTAKPKFEVDGAGGGRFDGLIPPGFMAPYAGSTAPTGWALCTGSSNPLSTALYPDLFATIGYTYGGSGTTFYPPDTRDRTLMGASATKTLGSTGGADTATLAASNLPGHTHGAGTLGTTTTGSAHTHDVQRGTAVGSSSGRAAAGNTTSIANMPSETTGSTHTHGVNGDTGTGNGLTNDPVDIKPKYLAVNHIIKL